MQNKFLFYKTDKQDDFSLKINNAKQKALICFQQGKDFEVVIQDLQETRSDKQLRGFYRLIDCIKNALKENGDVFTKQEIKDYFLNEAGHVKVIMGKEVVRSIANDSGTTKEEMKNIIETIVEFAESRGISSCYLEKREVVEFINYYK